MIYLPKNSLYYLLLLTFAPIIIINYQSMKTKINLVALGLLTATTVFAEKSVPNDTTATQLDDVVVTGTRSQTDVRHLPMTITTVSREKLTENQRINVLPTLTEQVPGLFVTSRGVLGFGVSSGGSGGINLRGISGGSGQMLILIDGHPQYQGIFGHGLSDSYQTLMAERVEVLRGPASVLYGSNAMGGVINIVTRGMKENGVHTHINLGVGSYGTVQTEASNQVRSGKFSSTVAAQYSRSDNHRPRMGFEQYGGYVKLGYDISNHWNVYADADITHFNASNPGRTSKPMYEQDQWITRGVVSAALENHYDRTSGALSVYDNFGRHKINDGYSEGENPQTRLFRSKDALAGISWYQSVNLFEGNRVTAGIDYQHIYGKAYYTDRETGEELDTQYKQSARSYRNEIAGYVDFRQDITKWLTVDAGIRLDHHSVAGTEWIPQGGIVVRPIETGEVKAMVSKGFRNPTMRELYLYPPSNENLEPERLMNYELSWKHRVLNGALSYGINVYYMKADNLIQTVGNANVNTGVLENSGVELEATYRLDSHWTLNTNHSYLHMVNPVEAAPTYKGYLGANYRYAKWNVAAGLQQISGLYTAAGDNEKKENFTLLNATVNYQLLNNLALWVRGENLLAQSYEINLGFPMPHATIMGGVNIRF